MLLIEIGEIGAAPREADSQRRSRDDHRRDPAWFIGLGLAHSRGARTKVPWRGASTLTKAYVLPRLIAPAAIDLLRASVSESNLTRITFSSTTARASSTCQRVTGYLFPSPGAPVLSACDEDVAELPEIAGVIRDAQESLSTLAGPDLPKRIAKGAGRDPPGRPAPADGIDPHDDIRALEQRAGPADVDPFRDPAGQRRNLPSTLGRFLDGPRFEVDPLICEQVKCVDREIERVAYTSCESRLARAGSADDVNPLGGFESGVDWPFDAHVGDLETHVGPPETILIAHANE